MASLDFSAEDAGFRTRRVRRSTRGRGPKGSDRLEGIAALDPRLSSRVLLLRVRVLGTRVHEQCVAARVNRGTEPAGVLSREMHVIVIAHVRHDLTAQRAPPPLVAVTLSLKYLRYPPIFQLCNNRNHRVSKPRNNARTRRDWRSVISLFLAVFPPSIHFFPPRFPSPFLFRRLFFFLFVLLYFDFAEFGSRSTRDSHANSVKRSFFAPACACACKAVWIEEDSKRSPTRECFALFWQYQASFESYDSLRRKSAIFSQTSVRVGKVSSVEFRRFSR